MEIDVRCEGLEELLNRLERMGRNTEPVLERALERGAKRLQAEIKPIVPVDEGTLRNSITVEKSDRLAYAVGTNLDYSIYVEYGTGKLGDPAVPHTDKERWVYFSDKLGRFVATSGQPARHFMHRGFMAGKDAAVKEVQREVERWLT